MIYTRTKFIFLLLLSGFFIGIIYFGNVYFDKENTIEEFNKHVENDNKIMQNAIDFEWLSFTKKEFADGKFVNGNIIYNGNVYSLFVQEKNLIYINSINQFFVSKTFEDELYVKKAETLKSLLDNCSHDSYYISLDGSIFFTNTDDESSNIYSIIKNNSKIDTIQFNSILESKSDSILVLDSFDKKQLNLFYNEIFEGYIVFSSIKNFEVNNIIIFNLLMIMLYILVFMIIYVTYRRNKPLILDKNDLKYFIFLSIDEKGNILYSNNVFKKLFKGKKNFLNEFEFATDTDIKLDNRLKIKYENKFKSTFFLDFIIFRTKKEIFLIGDNNNSQYFDNNLDDFDVLTGLYNKKALSNDINKIFQNRKDYTNVVFYLLDIKDFSSLNKLYGENYCDEIIVQIGKILKNTKNKYVYRMENDRFMIIKTDFNRTDDYIGYIRKFLDENLKEVTIFNQSLFIKFSCAIYFSDKQNESQSFEILEKLNLTLKDAKSKGSLINIFDENLNRKFNTQVEILKVLEDSITNNTFDFFYQPQYDIINQEIFGLEALIRLKTPSYKNISPSVFIDIAEKKGLINKIGDLIIENVFKFVSENITKNMHVSINVSVIQLMNEGFVSRLLEEYHRYNFVAGMIAIEITETILINNFDEVIRKLNLIRNEGINIYIDDFGSGYSSLLYLKDLPIDVIKLDKEFINLIEIDEAGKTIVKKIIEMAMGLNLKVIAEGVETEKQKEILKEFGCSFIQGYLISKPLNEDDCKKFLLNKGEKV